MDSEIDKAIELLKDNGYQIGKDGFWYLGRMKTKKARFHSYKIARSVEYLKYCTEYTILIPDKFDWKPVPPKEKDVQDN